MSIVDSAHSGTLGTSSTSLPNVAPWKSCASETLYSASVSPWISYTTSILSFISIRPTDQVTLFPSLADSLVNEDSFSPFRDDLTDELSIENVPGTMSCNAKSSKALSEVLWNISKISYLPAPPPGNTSFPVLICLLL